MSRRLTPDFMVWIYIPPKICFKVRTVFLAKNDWTLQQNTKTKLRFGWQKLGEPTSWWCSASLFSGINFFANCSGGIWGRFKDLVKLWSWQQVVEAQSDKMTIMWTLFSNVQNFHKCGANLGNVHYTHYTYSDFPFLVDQDKTCWTIAKREERDSSTLFGAIAHSLLLLVVPHNESLRKHPPHAIAHHSRCKAIQHHPKFRPVQVKLEIEMRVIIPYHSYEQGDTIVIHPSIFLQLQHTITLTYEDNYNYKHCWSTYWACGPWGHFLPDSWL